MSRVVRCSQEYADRPIEYERENVETDLPWVVGLGSNHGDDQAGWKVIAGLLDMNTFGIRLVPTVDPLAIVDVPSNCELLVVVDACRGTGHPGTVDRFVWPDPRLISTDRVSSHGVGLIAALRLAEALGRPPRRVVVFTIETESCEPGDGMSPLVEAAIPKVVELVVAETSIPEGRHE